MRRYLDVRYDVTGMTDDEVGNLAMEAAVCAEASERHPSVPPPESETVEVLDTDDRDRIDRERAAASLYFGCWRQPGHYLWRPGMTKMPLAAFDLTPWGSGIDGRLFPPRARPGEGVAGVFHAEGWTALAFEDRSVDRRPQSWSVYLVPAADLTYAEALRVARLAFPQVFERYQFAVSPWPGNPR